MNVTIKDIARIANVSIATVSRVLNEEGGYSVETKKKVLAVTNELGYTRNENARSLVKKSSNIIGVIMPNVATIFYGDIVSGIETLAYQYGYSVIISHAGISGHRFQESVKLMGERKVDGLVIVTVELNEERLKAVNDLNIHYILLSTDTVDKQAPYIKVNDFDAAYCATEYLIKNGHEKIGLAGVNAKDRVAGIPRIEGYKQALLDYQLLFDPIKVKYGDFSFYAGQKAMTAYLEEKIEVTAVFGVSDDVALGVISTAFNYGIKVPDDLSVIGYDNTRIAEMAIPPLTSIAQPFFEMGEEGCKILIEAIQEKKAIPSKIIPFKLVERKSVNPLHSSVSNSDNQQKSFIRE